MAAGKHKRHFDDPKVASEAGRKGQQALMAKLRRKGMMAQPIVTTEDAKERLSEIVVGVLKGDVDGKDADVAIRGVRAWLEAHRADIEQGELKELRAQIVAIQDAMKGRANLSAS